MADITVPSAYADAKLAFYEVDQRLYEAIRYGNRRVIPALVQKWREAELEVRLSL